jgi:hypothetical protein
LVVVVELIVGGERWDRCWKDSAIADKNREIEGRGTKKKQKIVDR